MAAQYSIPYAVVVGLSKGRPRMRDFSEETIRDPTIQTLLRSCRVVRRERFSGMGKITVKLSDGRSISRDVVDTNLMVAEVDKQSTSNKFLDLTSSLIEIRQQEKIIEAVEHLEELEDVRKLTKMMISPRTAPEGS